MCSDPSHLSAQMRSFTTCLFDPVDIVEVRRLPVARSTWHVAAVLESVGMRLLEENGRGQNLYIGANPRPAIGARGDACITIAHSLFADFDGIESPAVAAERIERAGLPTPTVGLWSGHGVHCYWRLRYPFDDLDRWSAFQMDLAALLGSDPVVFNAERIMRLPGFQNHKPPPCPSNVLWADPSLIYENDDLLESIPGVKEHWLGILGDEDQLGDLQKDVVSALRPIGCKAESHGDGVIAEWNRSVPVADLLARHGYAFHARKFAQPGKWLCDGYSGHIIQCSDGTERSIHFSANDVLNDRKFSGKRIACGVHDAFDVYRLLECAGDQTLAVRAAQRRWGSNAKHSLTRH